MWRIENREVKFIEIFRDEMVDAEDNLTNSSITTSVTLPR